MEQVITTYTNHCHLHRCSRGHCVWGQSTQKKPTWWTHADPIV